MEDAVILYPAPFMGHLVSMVEFGKLIHSSSPSLKIHVLLTTGFLDTPSTADYLRQISLSFPFMTFHRFPLLSLSPSPTVSRVPVVFEFIRLNGPNVRGSLLEISQSSTIRALVIDFFCASALPIASELKIPTYYFFSSGAAALAAYLYFPTIHNQINISFKDLPHTHLQIPGLPPLRATHMPEPVLDRDEPPYHDILYFSLLLPKSSGIIVNTFQELEPVPMKAVAEGLCVPDSLTPPIYCIGPILTQADQNRGGSIDDVRCKCLQWLDLQPRRSVVFLCFGSRGLFSADQLKEMAIGLERSGQRFLWVVRNPHRDEESEIGGLMPEGFLERTKERGMVVNSWAPQVEVLSHESVGGFVTHCGWNSVLEAVVAGVPMLAWPLYAEQHLNKAALVEDMKMAIAVDQREEDGFVSGAELEKRVRELMDWESVRGRSIRQWSLKMREKALAAWAEFGPSTTALAHLTKRFVSSG
ncbi:hypothetical protein NMG60_11025638 [Bertholletia excelsa]